MSDYKRGFMAASKQDQGQEFENESESFWNGFADWHREDSFLSDAPNCTEGI